MTFEEFATPARIHALLRTATAISRDRALAEDLVQEVLTKAYAHWARVSTAEDPDAYVGRMLINEHLSWRRRWGRSTPSGRIHLVDAERDFAQQHAEHDRLTRMIATLPARQQVVLTLKYLDGCSDHQIGYLIGCRPATVRAYASRALATLRTSESAAGPTMGRRSP